MAFNDSDRQYRLLFDNNPNPMWIYDVETLRFVAVNDAAVGHYRYSRAEFLSMSIRDIRPPEDVGPLEEAVSNIPEPLYMSGTWRHLKKDGTIIFVEVTSHSMDFNGRPARVVLAVDVTTRKKTEDELKEYQERLQGMVEERTAELMKANRELQEALLKVKTLSGMLPICAWCKKVRDDRGYWNHIETYVREHSAAEFTHSICPDCARAHYPKQFREKEDGPGKK